MPRLLFEPHERLPDPLPKEKFYDEFDATSDRLVEILTNMKARPHFVDGRYKASGWILVTAWLGKGRYYQGSRSWARADDFDKRRNEWKAPDPLRGALRAAALALFRKGEKSEEAFPIRYWTIDFVDTEGKEQHLSVEGPGTRNPPEGAQAGVRSMSLRTAKAIGRRLWRAGERALARALVTAAGTTFMVEIKSKPPKFIYDYEGERVTDDAMIHMLSGFFRDTDKRLKKGLKLRDFSTRGRWPTVYIDSPEETEALMYAAEAEVMRILRDAAAWYVELGQWVDDIDEKDLELGIL